MIFIILIINNIDAATNRDAKNRTSSQNSISIIPTFNNTQELINHIKDHSISEENIAQALQRSLRSTPNAINLHYSDLHNQNLLHIAIGHNRPNIAEILLNQKSSTTPNNPIINFNQQSFFNDTPLTMAIFKNYINLAKKLIDAKLIIDIETLNKLQTISNVNHRQILLNAAFKKLKKNNNPFKTDIDKNSLIYEIIQYAYKQYQHGNWKPLAHMLGINQRYINTIVIEKVKSYFNPNNLTMIMLNLQNEYNQFMQQYIDSQKRLQHSLKYGQPGTGTAIGLSSRFYPQKKSHFFK